MEPGFDACGENRPRRFIPAASLALCVLILALAAGPVAAGPPAGHPAQAREAPRARPDGRPWTLAYYEGGDYKDYMPVLRSMVDSLAARGWISDPVPACFEEKTHRAVWECLSDSLRGPYLRLVREAFWTAGWDSETRRKNQAEALARFTGAGDIDAVIAMGTWAGQDLAVDGHSVPTLVCSTSNPQAAGIIRSPEDSGRDHVHARIDPNRYARQVRLFHQVAGFKRLGLVFEDTPEGRTYAGLEQVEPVARELGVELVACNAPFSGVDLAQSEAAVQRCHEELAPRVDAFYLTTHRGVNRTSIATLLRPFHDRKIPVFAMGTEFEVRRGALMSMANPNYFWAGDFYVQTLARILNGQKPRSIGQVFADPHRVAVNLQTARLLGLDLPMELLCDAGEIYETIEETGPTP